MSKKSRHKRRIVPSQDPQPLTPAPVPECRVLLVSKHEVEVLDRLLEHYAPNSSLAGDIKRLLREFQDHAKKLEELTITARANGFWVEDKGQVAKIIKGAKDRKSAAQREAKPLSPQEIQGVVAQLLEEQERERLAKNGKGSPHG